MGEGIPHGDPLSVQGWHTPFYNSSHHEFRRKCREFVDN